VRRARFAALALLLASICSISPVLAQRTPAKGPAKQPDVAIPTGSTLGSDAQDIVFIDSSRVLFIRLHLQLNGLGFRESWDLATDKFFTYADANGDGTLSPTEAASGIRALAVNVTAGAMDTSPKDGKVSKEEWTAALARFADAQFSPVQGAGQVYAVYGMAAGGGNPGSALWRLLDIDGDKSLSKDEFAAAQRSLQKFDLDDDEVVQATELQPYNSNLYGQYVFSSNAMVVAQSPDGPTVLVMPSQGKPSAAAQQIIERRDGIERPKNQKLSPKELPISKEEFAAADADKDGQLAAQELAEFLSAVKPHLALIVRQGPEAGRRGKFALASVDGKPAPLAASLRGNPRGTLSLDVGSLQLQFTAADWSRPTNFEQQYKPQFQSIDQDGNGYLDKQETMNYFQPEQFAETDRDRDGMIFFKEYVEYYRQREEVSQSRISLQGNDQGKLLFDLLDANRDGRLSSRELAESPERLSGWDRGGDGKLNEDEVPHQYTLTIGRGGNTGNVYTAATPVAGIQRPTPTSSANAPTWFQKMDRNRDGDLTRREFLGSLEAFDRLDIDRDGLIDPSEAAKAK
jgi:Ca2+-binding EF-hand superfamily protein